MRRDLRIAANKTQKLENKNKQNADKTELKDAKKVEASQNQNNLPGQ
jgi:hypothetical protein